MCIRDRDRVKSKSDLSLIKIQELQSIIHLREKWSLILLILVGSLCAGSVPTVLDALRVGILGGAVFLICEVLLHSILDRISSGAAGKYLTRVKRSYSPWSSKIYTLRETPHKK